MAPAAGWGWRPGIGTATVLLVAANSMAINVRERISEVAVIRALGFEPTHVATMLFGEAALMGLIGGAAGFGRAVLASRPRASSRGGVQRR